MKNNQNGAVLITSLIVLLVLTILAITSAQSTILQEKMSFAMRDTHLALQGAELAITEAEQLIEGLATTSDFNGSGEGGLFSFGTAPVDLSLTTSWENIISTNDTVHNKVDSAEYFIEHLGVLGDSSGAGSINITNYGQTTGGGVVNSFRIVAKGEGISSTTQRIVISYYNKIL